jgi:magnesium transporter
MEELDMLVEKTELLLEAGGVEELKEFLDQLNISEVEALIDELPDYGPTFIETLTINRAVNVFRILDFPTQERILKKLSGPRISDIINEMPPDDRTSFFSELKGDLVKQLIILLSPADRKEALALLGYPEDSVGRLMTPDYITVKQHWDIQRVLEHVRKYGKTSETIDVLYVIDKNGVLLDDIRIRDIVLSDPDIMVKDLIDSRLIALNANDPQEEAIHVFRMNNRVALPVVDDQGIMLGIVTVDDILWVANEEYSEDMQRIGGTEALSEPYLDVSILHLFKKRAGWLVVLFIGQLFTTTVMEQYQSQLTNILLLAFVPLIISSGGNSGSQASTLIIQAMALGDVTLTDWWRVMRREIVTGLMLGGVLALMGFLRIYVYQSISGEYGPFWYLIGVVVSISLLCVVLWGSVVGSMLPFILRRFGLDPATSSTPFVSTLVDVTGLLIYFTFISLLLSQTNV